MYGLTQLGIWHTVISLMTLAAGFVSLIRFSEISWETFVGEIYVVTTIIVCIISFGIYQHGGFGKPHILGIITLITLVLAYIAGSDSKPFGKKSKAIAIVSYSATFLFSFDSCFYRIIY